MRSQLPISPLSLPATSSAPNTLPGVYPVRRGRAVKSPQISLKKKVAPALEHPLRYAPPITLLCFSRHTSFSLRAHRGRVPRRTFKHTNTHIGTHKRTVTVTLLKTSQVKVTQIDTCKHREAQ